jgi:hypothetical protein
MTAFDLTQYNNINKMLNFKKYNEPSIYYDVNKNTTYTTYCLSKYYTSSENPRLYGPDFVVITYTYWHKENFKPVVVLGYDYDKDVQPNWHDAASYYTR